MLSKCDPAVAMSFKMYEIYVAAGVYGVTAEEVCGVREGDLRSVNGELQVVIKFLPQMLCPGKCPGEVTKAGLKVCGVPLAGVVFKRNGTWECEGCSSRPGFTTFAKDKNNIAITYALNEVSDDIEAQKWLTMCNEARSSARTGRAAVKHMFQGMIRGKMF